MHQLAQKFEILLWIVALLLITYRLYRFLDNIFLAYLYYLDLRKVVTCGYLRGNHLSFHYLGWQQA